MYLIPSQYLNSLIDKKYLTNMNAQNYENKTITLTLKNKQIKLIQAALAKYQGDQDLLDNTGNLKETRDIIHNAWTLLNPS